MKHIIIALAIVCYSLFNTVSGQNTTKRNLITGHNEEIIDSGNIVSSEILIDGNLFMPEKITIKNFEKKVQDAREGFSIVNNTPWHISRLNILFRYTDMDNNIIHERTVMTECDLAAGAVRQTTVKSFDTMHQYYYYLSKQPRREARPFKVSVKILRYDIVAD